ncbi:hypothetical protein JB92DRAFT_3114451 [Gautieria morchelliformis]|nr:hypothetical protein JB92DRAFT_3114451 [Gautieria morchelliformis]
MTEVEAREIYNSCFPITSTPAIPKATTIAIPNAGSNIQMLSVNQTELSQPRITSHLSDQANTWLLSTVEDTDLEIGCPNESDSELDEDSEVITEGPTTNYNAEGVQQQLHDKICHLAQTVLPQLHGLVNLLNDMPQQQFETLRHNDNITEIQEVSTKLQEVLSQVTGSYIAPGGQLQVVTQSSKPSSTRLAKVTSSGHTKRLLPPSPEQRQRQKTSHSDR